MLVRLSCVGVCGAALAAGLWVLVSGAIEPAHEPVRLLERPGDSAGIERSPFGIAQHDRRVPEPRELEMPPAAVASRSQEVARLSASADPHDAWRAYTLVDTCVRAREVEAAAVALSRGPDTAAARDAMASGWVAAAEVCQDIKAEQIAARLRDLDTAVAAGVAGAAVALADEGPFGDRTALAQRPDDPLVLEWKRRVIELETAAARRGDRAAIVALANEYHSGGLVDRDPQQALMYWAAQRELERQSGLPLSRSASRVAAARGSGLGAEQLAQAFAGGQQLALGCCKATSKAAGR